MDATWMTTTFVLIDTTTKRAISVYTCPDKKAPYSCRTVLFYAITAIIEMYRYQENAGAGAPYVDKIPAQTPVLHGFATRLNH
jgi:hypothetical protein